MDGSPLLVLLALLPLAAVELDFGTFLILALVLFAAAGLASEDNTAAAPPQAAPRQLPRGAAPARSGRMGRALAGAAAPARIA